jgi:hypothetical protein
LTWLAAECRQASSTYACSGAGIAPNCCIMSRVSVTRQCSRILPSDIRWSSTCVRDSYSSRWRAF